MTQLKINSWRHSCLLSLFVYIFLGMTNNIVRRLIVRGETFITLHYFFLCFTEVLNKRYFSLSEVKVEIRDDQQLLYKSSNGQFELFLLTAEGSSHSDGATSSASLSKIAALKRSVCLLIFDNFLEILFNKILKRILGYSWEGTFYVERIREIRNCKHIIVIGGSERPNFKIKKIKKRLKYEN